MVCIDCNNSNDDLFDIGFQTLEVTRDEDKRVTYYRVSK